MLTSGIINVFECKLELHDGNSKMITRGCAMETRGLTLQELVPCLCGEFFVMTRAGNVTGSDYSKLVSRI